MPNLTKLAAFLDSFKKDDPNYETACFIKSKIAEDLNDSSTINNGADEQLDDNEVTMATPEQQAQDNYEGGLLSPAFKELDALNKIEEDKDKIDMSKATNKNFSKDQATPGDFGNIPLNQSIPASSKTASFFNILQSRLKK